MRKYFFTLALLYLPIAVIFAQKASENTPRVELIKNHSFEDEASPIRNRRFGPNGEGELFGGYLPAGTIPGWIMVNNEKGASRIEISTENLLDSTQHKALRWDIAEVPASIANVGRQGIAVTSGNQYVLTFWARANKRHKGKLQVGLQSKNDGTWYALTSVTVKIKKKWKKYTLTFTAEQSAKNARLVITTDTPGILYLDEVSLYSPASIKR